jgi:hypothetical protein
MTIEKFMQHQVAIMDKFGCEPLAYANVSYTQLSIARHYGGCKVQGRHFIYNPIDDSLIREDVVKWLAKQERKANGQ